MYCEEPFTPGHQFKHKKTQLMIMELDDDEPNSDSNEESPDQTSIGAASSGEDIQVSLHSLTGLPSYQTMKICGSHNQKTLQILLDLGGTHNFLIQALYVCRNFTCQIQQTTFTADVVVLPLGFYDLILGIPFLKYLGPILWALTDSKWSLRCMRKGLCSEEESTVVLR